MNAFQLNAIKFEFTRLGLSETEGINLLDEEGLISNLVIDLFNIDTTDAQKSLEWLRKQPTKINVP